MAEDIKSIIIQGFKKVDKYALTSYISDQMRDTFGGEWLFCRATVNSFEDMTLDFTFVERKSLHFSFYRDGLQYIVYLAKTQRNDFKNSEIVSLTSPPICK